MIITSISDTLPTATSPAPYSAIALALDQTPHPHPSSDISVPSGHALWVAAGSAPHTPPTSAQWVVIHWQPWVTNPSGNSLVPLDALSLLLVRESLQVSGRTDNEKDGACRIIAARLDYTWESKHQSASAASPTLVESATHYLYQHLDQATHLTTLSEALGYSKVHLIQSFKRAGLKSPMRYLNDLRISKAKELLEVTDNTVLGVATAVGFNSASRFSQAFKQQTGHSPLAWRKRATWLL